MDRIEDEYLEAIARALEIHVDWLRHGVGPKYLDDRLNAIKSAVNDPGADYKGLDRTLSDVELKAKSLIRELQSLVDSLGRLRGH